MSRPPTYPRTWTSLIALVVKMTLLVVTCAALCGAAAVGIAFLLVTQGGGEGRGGEMLFIGFAALAGWLAGACIGLVLAVRLFGRRSPRKP